MAIIFDVNETLLDFGALDRYFGDRFESGHGRVEWFLTLQSAWMAQTLTGQFTPFITLALGALRQVAARHDIVLSHTHQDGLVERLMTLPAHGDVIPALQWLKDHGQQVVALTNGGAEAVEQQLSHAGLRPFFDRVLSVEAVKAYKPAPAVYAYAIEQVGEAADQITMIAAHDWDLIGAAQAGMQTGFIARPGKAVDDEGFQPDYQSADLLKLVQQVIAV